MVKYAPKIERKSKHTKEDLAKAKANGISFNAFYQRLNKGWTVEQAINTPVRKKTLYSENELAVMKLNNLTKDKVNKRITNGVPRGLAIRVPADEICTKQMIEEYEFEEMKKEETRKKRKAKREKKEKELLMKKKPHLFKVQQKTVRGEYCKHLWENDIFPKRKVEC
ncbi:MULTISPECIES: SA1788 family PVL leukocidin-associated protein [unclassified Mammaliicoccus]|uniref:SA1788 family PVL leukocidin-associated protein n=1 Tax=unclassified Mammaliicoccus TaxID=2803851 RepID=UPI001EFC1F5E|nr:MULTISPECIES: SA1788 family PVL leukocidin-associated protein [unclassified Mammaliicoccus]